jgi:hypothetical protein
MNQITQVFPCSKGIISDFSTTAELLALPWVVKWTQLDGFKQFSKHEHFLMAELQGSYCRIGSIKEPSTVDLPIYPGPVLSCVTPNGWTGG